MYWLELTVVEEEGEEGFSTHHVLGPDHGKGPVPVSQP